MYLTFAEYNQYSERVEESAFSDLERKARHKLDYFTQDRIKNKKSDVVTPDVKECMALLIDQLAEMQDQKVSSFSNGAVSVSFEKDSQTDDDVLWNIVTECLPLSLTSLAVNV